MPIIDYAAPVKVSKYADMLKAELDALLKAGEGKATEFKVPTVDANKVRVEFARLANEADKTARIQVMEPDGKTRKDKDSDGNTIEVPIGDTRFVITLTQRHAQRRGKNKPAEGEATAPAE